MSGLGNVIAKRARVIAKRAREKSLTAREIAEKERKQGTLI